MTLAEWQTAPKMIESWRVMVKSEVFQAALSVLESLGPTAFCSTHNATTPRATLRSCLVRFRVTSRR